MGEGLSKLSPTMSSMAVAEAGVAGFLAGRRRIVPGAMNRVSTFMSVLIPRALVLPVIARVQAARR